MAWPFLAVLTGALLGLKPTCSICRTNQLVTLELKHRVVKGKFCGAAIPPR